MNIIKLGFFCCLIFSVHGMSLSELRYAGIAGKTALIDACAAEGADLNSADDQGNTALHGAATYGQNAAVRALLDSGADVNPVNIYNRTPLDDAIRYHQTSVIRTLLCYGAHRENRSSSDPIIQRLLSASRETLLEEEIMMLMGELYPHVRYVNKRYIF